MRLLRAAALAFAALALIGSAHADGESCIAAPGIADVQQAAKSPPHDRGLLWRVEKDGRTSWLYGTIHVGKLEWIVPGPTIVHALAASDAVVLELDLSKPEELQSMMPPVDRASAERVLAGGLGARLKVQMRKVCVPEALTTQMRPAMQAVAAMALSARSAGLHPELGIDLLINGMAPRLGKPLVALETVQQQLAFILPESEDDERAMVADALDQLESRKSDAMLERMARAWESGDAATIASYVQWCDCVNTPSEKAMLKRLLDDRNPPMADKLAALHAQGKTFFAAVGALHMSGEQSLVTLLRARGFTVTPVAFAP